MYKNLFIACLLIAVSTSAFFITPAYPQAAYQNQFYNVRFRVRGLDNPIFYYEGLPKSLIGSKDGIISGIPITPGAFSILIKYKSDRFQGSSEVILKVLEDYRNKDFIVKSTATKVGLVIEYPENLIFRVGQAVKIPFAAKNSFGRLIWSFIGLPSGIKGSALEGSIDGTIQNAGYYNFQVECTDGEGKSAQQSVTINIQPKASLTTTNVVQVSQNSLTSSSLSTYNKIEAEQVAADNQLFKALDVVDIRKKIVADMKQNVATATLRLINAQISFDAAETAWKKATNDKQNALNLFVQAQIALDAAQKNLQIALTEQGQSAKTLADARKILQEAQQRFNTAQKNLSQAQAILVPAKAQYSKAQQVLRTAQNQRAAANQEYKRAFQALEIAKTQLEDARARKIAADQTVKFAKDALEIAQQARDDAVNALQKADFNLANTEKALDAALKKVAAIREKYNIAKKQLSSAQLDWQLALNKLYVAQSRKETADRASSIALAEGSKSDHNANYGVVSVGGSSSLTNLAAKASFGGCDVKAYPSISGSSKVISVDVNGYKLASGHDVVFGSCSQASGKVAMGDFIKYNGYINNGVINALRIERLIFS